MLIRCLSKDIAQLSAASLKTVLSETKVERATLLAAIDSLKKQLVPSNQAGSSSVPLVYTCSDPVWLQTRKRP